MRIYITYISILLLTLVYGCDLFEPDNNVYPDAKSELRIVNNSDMDLEYDVFFNGDSTTYQVAANAEIDFEEYNVGPQTILVRNGETVVDTADAFLEFGKPSTLFMFGNETTNGAQFLNHKKTYNDTTAYIRFLNIITDVPAVDIYTSNDTYTTQNDSIFFTSNSEYFADTAPRFEDLEFGDGNLGYDPIDEADNFSIIVTEAGNDNNVLLDITIEIVPTVSKTLLLDSGELHEYTDQFE